MRVSVVVCTYNRADGLAETLASLTLQRFRQFEVVVVNGPSTDHTASVLDSYVDAVKVVDNPRANLSVSRNLGIRAAAGEIVAFIDDDALPEPSWLQQAVPHFADPEVAGVGGIVLDHTGMCLQYRYSAATRFGEPMFSDSQSFESCCLPGASTFPYLQGTNALFRRSALAEIGLFDEIFDFYLDETDVCVRLIDAGYVLRELPDAPVHHKYLPSARRNESRVVTNWSSIVRNHVYFGYRHALVDASEFEVLAHAKTFHDQVIADAEYHEAMGVVPDGHVDRAREAADTAIAEGMRLGREHATSRRPPVDLDPPCFLPYPNGRPEDVRSVLLVSSGYAPNISGGIARFISDVAPELSARGHEVRVFTASRTVSTVDLESGVWVHRLVQAQTPGLVADGPVHVDGFATAVADELERISAWWHPDIAYGSLWDVELLGVARAHPDVPIVPMLATPAAEVADHEGWRDNHPAAATIRQLVRLERELVARSICVHAISSAIVGTFDRLYPGALTPSRTEVAHIGRSDDDRNQFGDLPKDPRVLYVGRLEARKGIDVFLDAAAELLSGHRTVEIVVAGAERVGRGETFEGAWRRRNVEGGDRLRFVGEISDDDLADLYSASSIVVMPSRYESFGLVVVEAMMHGRVPVGSDVGGIAELIEHGDNGVLVPAGDAAALAVALGELVDDPERLAAIATRARAHFERHLSMSSAVGRLETVLDSAVARASGPYRAERTTT